MRYPALVIVLTSLLLGACSPAVALPPTATLAAPASPGPVTAATGAAPIGPGTQQDLLAIVDQISHAPPAEAQARADALWQALVGGRREPLIFDPQVYFFYKGQAQRVGWSGGFNRWAAPGLQGTRVGQTDLWMAQLPMEPASRAEYKIAIDDQPPALDGANPLTQASGLTGTNSLLVMPGFTVTDLGQRRAGVPAGALSEPLSIASQYLGYGVNYWVYTPVGYEHQAKLPALYLLDGNDFVVDRMGALPIVLDNLIASGRIPPVLAVFISQREPGNPQNNRREAEFIGHPVEHARFIAEELVPAIDRAYRTDARPEARVIAGVSYGGLSAFFIALTESETFHNLAAFSPSLWALNYPESQPNAQQGLGVRVMATVIEPVTRCSAPGTDQCPRLPLRVFMTSGIPDWDVGDLASVADNLQRQGYPVDFHPAREAHTWSQWRGLSDEMLVYFFGAH